MMKMDVIVDSVKKEEITLEDFPFICRICLLPGDLRPFKCEDYLLDLFLIITQIDVKDEMAPATGNGICSPCIDKLEDISSFIHLSLCNDGKLGYAVGRKKYVKCETNSDAIGIDSSTTNGLKLEDVADNNEAMEKKTFEKTISDEIGEKQENIDIKEHILDTDLSNSVLKTYQAELATPSQNFTRNMIPKKDSLYLAEEEFSLCDWSKNDTTHKSNSRQEMVTNTRKKFKCDLCAKRFTRKSDLQYHLLIHTGEKLFECDYCEKSFNRKGNLKKHLRIHTGEKPFKCDICDKSFTEGSSLRNHMLTHSGKKPFECDSCKKCFKQKWYLKIHLRTHIGEKPFKCGNCDKSFSQGIILRNHMLTHTGEKPFKCDCCEKSCARKGDLKRHLLTHTGEKPFECDWCKKSFREKGNLNKHLLTHKLEKSHSNVIAAVENSHRNIV